MSPELARELEKELPTSFDHPIDREYLLWRSIFFEAPTLYEDPLQWIIDQFPEMLNEPS